MCWIAIQSFRDRLCFLLPRLRRPRTTSFDRFNGAADVFTAHDRRRVQTGNSKTARVRANGRKNQNLETKLYNRVCAYGVGTGAVVCRGPTFFRRIDKSVRSLIRMFRKRDAKFPSTRSAGNVRHSSSTGAS